MSKSNIMKIGVIAAIVVVCIVVAAVYLVSTGDGDDSTSSTGSGDVAATVNGVDIYEDTITTYIESFRSTYGLDEEEDWADWMITYGYTVESVREEVIESYIERELILEEAEAQGVTVDSSEIDEYVEYMIEQLGDEETFLEALESAGMTEEEYREELEVQMIDAALEETFATDEEVSEDDMLTYAVMYASSYDGAKKSSHILFDDEDTANEVLEQLEAGEITFEEAVAEYSTDDSSVEDDGNVGWDLMSSFVDEYQEALDELDEGEMSGVVESDYGYHIILCTEVYNAPTTTDEDGEESVNVTSLDDIPEDWLDDIEELLQDYATEEAYAAWLEEAYEEADITIYDMPDDLSYYVDLSLYETDDEEDETDTE